MEKEKTAVEWLNEQLKHTLTINQMNDVVIMDLFKEAKEMEKEQAERMYSEEEVRNAYRYGTTVNHGTKQHFNEWFEQFKKK